MLLKQTKGLGQKKNQNTLGKHQYYKLEMAVPNLVSDAGSIAATKEKTLQLLHSSCAIHLVEQEM